MSEITPETSIVIRAFNEERWLPELLAALAHQTYRDFETIVVDSGSVDRTRAIALGNGARLISLRSEDFTFGYSLNIGIEAARGAYIVIISAHAIPTDEHWLERLIAPLRQSRSAMVFGGQRGHALSKFSEARDFERVFHDKPMVMDDDHVFVNNANSAIKKSLWEEHSFDEGLPGLEDAEWAKFWIPLGWNVIYEPSACVYHVHTESWVQVRHRFYREGIAGRWTAVRIIRHIPAEILRELWWTVKDLALAGVRRSGAAICSEIVRYRYNKAIGIVNGILASRRITNPSERAELHFDKGFSAVVVREANSARIEPRSIPKLRPSEVLVRVAYVGITASDLAVFEGSVVLPRVDAGPVGIVPGREISGTIVSIGSNVTELQEGDRVIVESMQGCGKCAPCESGRIGSCRDRVDLGSPGVDGGYAEYIVARARCVTKIPDALSLRRAVLWEPTAVAMKGIRRLMAATENSPQECAVLGSDAIAYLVANILMLRGYKAARLAGGIEGVRSADEFVLGAERPHELSRFAWFVAAAGEEGLHDLLVHDCRSGSGLLLLASANEWQRLLTHRIVSKDLVVVGSAGYSRGDISEAFDVLMRMDVAPLVQHCFPLEEFRQAWRAYRGGMHSKILLQVDHGVV